MYFRRNKLPASIVGLVLGLLCTVHAAKVNKHKPWIETTYHGIVTENDDKVLLDPPLIALDKDAPLHAGLGTLTNHVQPVDLGPLTSALSSGNEAADLRPLPPGEGRRVSQPPPMEVNRSPRQRRGAEAWLT
ncbi:hypothetical protein COCON_G00140990 [Conger conger]|uniref:Uncharacterized protein n=1 Tax=Conger conger TaxID=82655 RepID=A0A9Q1DAV1_CONCO|nr:hypothetical protein COCON_G00140990 [Conger conger]